MDKNMALLSLRLAAAKTAKLADDLERGRLWEGDLSNGIADVRKALDDAASAARGNDA